MNDRPSTQGVIEVQYPYTGEAIGAVPKAGVEDVRKLFAAAQAYRPKLARFERVS